MQLSDEIGKILNNKEISQRELARVSGVSYHEVKALKSSRLRHVSLLGFAKLLKVLGYEVTINLRSKEKEYEKTVNILYPKERLERIRKPLPDKVKKKRGLFKKSKSPKVFQYDVDKFLKALDDMDRALEK